MSNKSNLISLFIVALMVTGLLTYFYLSTRVSRDAKHKQALLAIQKVDSFKQVNGFVPNELYYLDKSAFKKAHVSYFAKDNFKTYELYYSYDSLDKEFIRLYSPELQIWTVELKQ